MNRKHQNNRDGEKGVFFTRQSRGDVFESSALVRGNPYVPFGEYNPTSAAVQHSIHEIFDDVTMLIAGELRDWKPESGD